MTFIRLSPLFFGIAFFLFYYRKNKTTIGILVLTALGIFLNAALLDPFLNLWDERFHALVAKNLLKHPFVPTLYDEKIPGIIYKPWDKTHIWLHKPPLFLWQIMVSLKIFGISEFAVRLPSALLATALVLIAYKSGKNLIGPSTGFFTAVLFGSSFYMIQLVSGRKELDHNDVSFVFYVSASIWSWTEFIIAKSGKKNLWIFLTALFSGFAILSKWLPGLLVYLAWGIYIVSISKINLSSFKPMLKSLTVTLVIVIPWLIYTYIQFPMETISETRYSAMHFTQAIEGHTGNLWYYFQKMDTLFNVLTPYLIIPGIIIFLRINKNKPLAWSLLGITLCVYIFYSMAATKMPSYTYIAVLPVFLFIGSLFDFTERQINKLIKFKWLNAIIFSLAVVAVTYINLNQKQLTEEHDQESYLYKPLTHNKQIFQHLAGKLPENTVLFNVKSRHSIEAMFYTEFPAYHIIPDTNILAGLKKRDKIAAVFNTGDLPEYLINDSTVMILNDTIEGYE